MVAMVVMEAVVMVDGHAESIKKGEVLNKHVVYDQ